MAERLRGAGARSGTRSRLDPARAAAYQVLARVRREDAYANLVLPAVLQRSELTGRDAAFVTELVYGTLRGQGTYDAALAVCTDRPLARVDPRVLDALRLGAHQLLGMRVPAHAAVDTTVDLVRAEVGGHVVGFTNAVLRRVAEHDLAGWVRRVAPDDDLGFRAVTSSHPAWVVELFGAALGRAVGELDDLLAADNAPPKVTLVARPGLATLAELEGAAATGLSPYAAVLEGGDPSRLPAVADGRAGVQDEGSQLVALAVAEAPLDGTDRRWLDACAGPGGKAALLGALAAQRGARVLAAEVQPHRAGLVAAATRALSGGLLGVVAADATAPAWRQAAFDRVLLDAPCTGLGALRRRPEARWRRTPEDLDELVPLQRRLLSAAVDSVRVGGLVGYATCSPVLAETSGVVTSVVESGRAEVVDASPLFPTDDDAGPLSGTVQLWPHRHGTDAMFFALVRRLR